MSLNDWKMIAETRGHIFRWRSSFRRRRVCLSSLLIESRRLLLTLLKFLSLSKMLPRLWLCKVYFPRPNVYFKIYWKRCNILDIPEKLLLHQFVSDPCQESEVKSAHKFTWQKNYKQNSDAYRFYLITHWTSQLWFQLSLKQIHNHRIIPALVSSPSFICNLGIWFTSSLDLLDVRLIFDSIQVLGTKSKWCCSWERHYKSTVEHREHLAVIYSCH